MATLHCQILTPEGNAFDGEVAFVGAQALDGQVGILPRHAPLLTALGKGSLRVKLTGGEEKKWQIDGGFMEVLNNEVSVVAERLTEA